ncbi:eukaryotic aspartyl protease domain-containing protein [Purpureocillium lilacinum]|uniref:Eukaryotic aspartyl protease domain-containing protein n=1 Tax=Purpureocillium lilacinum TaxID=33203 RepID=A0A179HEZ3_PURLI|nr:eukaryotic aspartyl protease domain-containing protein [Purpureocillium lilacinum]OAQ79653.1 eukaryotic aspartyl protease domain-containing protein [Purpureocillium lilacinum]OAQ88946.1 eukaryotic aspartyl protease domain-containing protein [Purpureocillium lilacinum]
MHAVLISIVALSLQTLALPVDGPGPAQTGVVHLPLTATPLHSTGRFKKRFRFSVPTVNDVLYTVSVAVGTPGTHLRLAFSLTSPSTWINPNCSNVDQLEHRKLCRTSGYFYQQMSKTFYGTDKTRHDFGMGPGELQMALDSVTLGFERQLIGVGSNTTHVALGVLGTAMGPSSAGEDNVSIVETLRRQGVTKRSAFSLDIRGTDNDGGSVLFGGIDTQKFSGPLVERQMALHPIMQASLKSPGEALDDRRISGAEPSTVVVSFDKLVITAADGTILPATEGKQLLASLDSSYTISYLPAPVAERITARFPSAQRHESAARDGSVYYTVDCDTAQLKGSLDFVLGDTTIKLPFEDLVGSKVNSESCFLGVASQPTDLGNQAILGANFLKRVYAVFDWQDYKVYLANAEDCGSNVRTLDQSTSIGTLVGECGDRRLELRHAV